MMFGLETIIVPITPATVLTALGVTLVFTWGGVHLARFIRPPDKPPIPWHFLIPWFSAPRSTPIVQLVDRAAEVDAVQLPDRAAQVDAVQFADRAVQLADRRIQRLRRTAPTRARRPAAKDDEDMRATREWPPDVVRGGAARAACRPRGDELGK